MGELVINPIDNVYKQYRQMIYANPYRFGIVVPPINYTIENAVFNSSVSVTAKTFLMLFNNDGSKFYLCNDVDEILMEYNLSVNYDITTKTVVNSVDLTAYDSNPSGMRFNNDGTKFYYLGIGSDVIKEFDLSIAWNISTMVLNGNTFPLIKMTNFVFNFDGTKLYCANLSETIFEYNLSIPFNVGSMVLFQSISSVPFNILDIRGLHFSIDGAKLFVITSVNDAIFELDLSIAWDISTLSYNGISISVSDKTLSPQGLLISFESNQMFFGSFDFTGLVWIYDI